VDKNCEYSRIEIILYPSRLCVAVVFSCHSCWCRGISESRTSSIHPIHYQHGCSRNVSVSLHHSSAIWSTGRLSMARSHRVSNAPTLRWCLRKQIFIRPTLSPTGWSQTCQLFPSTKLLERLVSSQLVNYLIDNDLLPYLQSAYSEMHSMETALLNILLALNLGHLAMLTLLDLFAAFDSIDHDTLLRRLQVLQSWFASYFCGCS